jgi:hypothetical protein
MRIFLILLTFFLLSSCRLFSDAQKPFVSGMKIEAPPGSPIFQQGFLDGCSFILYARGNLFYRFFFKYQYNPKLASNSEYTFGYRRGGSYCFNYIVTGVRSFDTMIFPFNNPMLAQNYNSTGIVGEPALDPGIPLDTNGGIDGIFNMWSGGSGGGALTGNPLWAGGSKGQFFGQ